MKKEGKKIIDRFFLRAGSPKTVVTLFLVLVPLLVPSTLLPAEKAGAFLLPGKLVLLCIGLSLAVCTWQRWQSLHGSTLVIHVGVMIVLVGSAAGIFGFVATVNIYEGDSAGRIYRWDAGSEIDPGFALRVDAIRMDYFPAPLRIGVLRNGKKAELVETRTGESFSVDRYSVQVERLDPVRRTVLLQVMNSQGEVVGLRETPGRNGLPEEFPLDFRLVAFKDPTLRRMWVELALLRGKKVLARGTSEVNHPLKWEGMRFFLTRVAADEEGRLYAGIQISRDPGLPLVYAGFAILCSGLFMAMGRWTETVRGKPGSSGDHST
ncbi:MAG: ResB-like family cytochrome C biogenesis protein [Desulfobulbaceae bacterium]